VKRILLSAPSGAESKDKETKTETNKTNTQPSSAQPLNVRKILDTTGAIR
jgi:hypothetical protein